MRVLVTTTSGAGHVMAVVPLALALRRAGHQVVWATASDGIELVRSFGFDAVQAGLAVGERTGQLSDKLPEIMQLPPEARSGSLFAGFFGIVAAPVMTEHLIPIVDKFRPNVIVHETAEFGAAPLAVARGIPHVTVGYSGAMPAKVVAQTLHCVAPAWALHGLGEPPPAAAFGALYLHPFPASMGEPPDYGSGCRMLRYRPGLSEAVGAAPPWLASFGGTRPAIYLTAGLTDVVTRQWPWSLIFDALSVLDADVLATIGPHADPATLGAVPRNVHVERFVPQHAVIPRAHLVVSHSGAGVTLAAAQFGVAQLLLPSFGDGFENTRALSSTGAALVCETNDRMPLAIRAKAVELLSNPAFPAAARLLAEEFAAMPPISDHLATIEALAGN